jgi:hypothetical protein
MTGPEAQQLKVDLGLSRIEFAKLLDLNERTVRRWEDDGTEDGFATVLREKLANPEAKPIIVALAKSAVEKGHSGLTYFLGRLLDALVVAEEILAP